MFKNNSKIRTWDDAIFFRPGNIVLTGKINPYQKKTLEFELVDFVMKQSGKKISSTLSKEVLSHLKNKKLLLSIDTWSFNDLGNRAIWLALNAGCIKFSNKKTSTNINFAVHLQSGLLDLFHEPSYLNKLILESPNTQHLEHLKQVALLSSQLKKEFNLPVMKETGSKLEITNYKSWMMERTENLPIQTWAKSNTGYVQAKTRGIYHHLGDEMAFICAATQYGSCYIVGNDEFGDLIILGVIKKKNSNYNDYNLGKIYEAMDFDYIYGVPVTNALYPAWRNHCFNYASEDYEQCQLNNKPNSELSNQYWENGFFVKEAQREIKALSIKEFSLKMSNIIKTIMTPEDYEIYKNLFNHEFFININTLFCNNYNSFYIHITKNNNNNLNDWKDYLYELLNSKLSVKDVLTVAEKIKENNNLQKGFITLVDTVIEKIIIMKKLIINYNQLFEEQFSFFYKTVSHKVHCDIINPKKIETSGFFMKDGNDTSTQKINLLNIFSEFIENIWLDKNYTTGSSSSLKKIRQLFLKEHKNNNDLFESIHKNALKKNIAEQLNPSESIYELIDFWDELNIPAFVVSNVIDMQNEYRIFVINNRPVSGSPCFRNTTPFNAWDNGRFDARLCKGHSAYDCFENDESRARVAQYARYAKKFARELKIQYPEQNNFVLDVAYSQDANNGAGGIIPIEINSITWSGAYQIDFRRVCAAIAKKPYHFSDMDEYGDFKTLLLQAKQKLEVINNMDNFSVDKLLTNLSGEQSNENDDIDEDEDFEKENDKQL